MFRGAEGTVRDYRATKASEISVHPDQVLSAISSAASESDLNDLEIRLHRLPIREPCEWRFGSWIVDIVS
jgi:hypothetical protein